MQKAKTVSQENQEKIILIPENRNTYSIDVLY